MNKGVFTLILQFAICVTLLTGCATVSQEEIETADFGEPPADYETAIKNFMSSRLKERYSPVYRFEAPRKGIAQDGVLRGNTKYFGWIVPTGIKVKNIYGGYTGERRYYFMFQNGLISDVTFLMSSKMARIVE